MYLTFSHEIKIIPFLDSLLSEKVVYFNKGIPLNKIKGVIGWGLKSTAKKARDFAKKNSLAYISIEDGFICSYGLRVKGYPPLSLIKDPLGIYYDATNPSLLENLLNRGDFKKEALLDAENALNLILKHNISKFNYQPEADESILLGKRKKKVLIIDQTFNDMSVILGMADSNTFSYMFETAIKENPDADIYVKIHPDVICGKKKGHFDRTITERDNVYIITQDVNPISLLRLFDRVYTVSSQMGFEALLLGKKVVCFGMPFYAGWGLTQDKIHCLRRKRKVDLIEMFYAAYISYCNYINPVSGQRGSIIDVIDFILRQREMADKLGKHNYYCVDFHIARKRFVKPFLQNEKNRVFFMKNRNVKRFVDYQDSLFVVWGSKGRKNLLKNLDKNVPFYTVEDGFIRSVGLGSEFIPPMSIVLDKRGIYYDPTHESDLEYILNNYEFSDEDIASAERIINLIIANNITKYNIERICPLNIKADNKKVILVPGQVEDDEAVILGGGRIKTNLSLLMTVRERNPEGYIIYKPHPDVLSNNRKADKDFRRIREIADHVETHANIISCIDASDEVHTLTSLSGFDALIRGKRVFTYGAGFYAGWGLTEDDIPLQRRKRRLTLNELVAGVLLIYPIYYDWKLKGFVDCETVINRIIVERMFANVDIKNKLPKILKKVVNYFSFFRRDILSDT